MLKTPDPTENEIARFFEVSVDLLCIADREGQFRRVNPSFHRTLGWSAAELVDRPLLDFVHADDREETRHQLAALVDRGAATSFENRFRCADGGYKSLVWTSSPDVGSGLLYSVARDMTHIKRDQERFRLALQASPTSMLMADQRGAIVMINRAAEQLFGYEAGELAGRSVDSLVPAAAQGDHARQRARFHEFPSNRPMGARRDLVARHRDGHDIPVEIGLNPVHLDDGMYVLAAIVDLTARKRNEEEILKLAHELELANLQLAELACTDSLTSLKNRRSLLEELGTYVHLARRSRRPLSLCLVDIDHFKPYNDEHGHLAGDEVLRVFARSLSRTARRSDLVGRMGGEEFAVAMPETDADGARRLAERARLAIEAESWPRTPVTASFGVATYTPTANDTEDVGALVSALLSAADTALYHSKNAGRNRATHVADLPSST